jgi:hypothetical protein
VLRQQPARHAIDELLDEVHGLEDLVRPHLEARLHVTGLAAHDLEVELLIERVRIIRVARRA